MKIKTEKGIIVVNEKLFDIDKEIYEGNIVMCEHCHEYCESKIVTQVEDCNLLFWYNLCPDCFNIVKDDIEVCKNCRRHVFKSSIVGDGICIYCDGNKLRSIENE